MTKADLVQRVADTIGPGVTKRDAAVVVDSFLNAIKDAMGEHQNIEIRGFGTFKVRERKSRLARAPSPGGGRSCFCTAVFWHGPCPSWGIEMTLDADRSRRLTRCCNRKCSPS
jgi:nucleoid DNA-binding protein